MQKHNLIKIAVIKLSIIIIFIDRIGIYINFYKDELKYLLFFNPLIPIIIITTWKLTVYSK